MRHNLYKSVALHVFFCAFVCKLFAQNVSIKHYGVNNGLPSSETYCVTQDSKGYIWIGTDAGVVKYDGYSFKTYTGTKGLPDNTVFKIYEDKKGMVWFASFSGELSYYNHRNDSIYTIPANDTLVKYANTSPLDVYIERILSGYLTIEKGM